MSQPTISFEYGAGENETGMKVHRMEISGKYADQVGAGILMAVGGVVFSIVWLVISVLMSAASQMAQGTRLVTGL